MKILYISRAVLPSETSNSLSIMRMCQALSEEGNQVLLAGVRPVGAREDVHAYYGSSGAFRVTTIATPARFRTRWRERVHALNARWLAARFQPDLIYSRLCLGELGLLPPDVPVVYEMHSPGPVGRSEGKRLEFERLLERKNVVRLVVTTDVLRGYLLERYPDMDVCLARLSAPEPTPLPPDAIHDFKKRNLRGRGSFDVGYTGFLDDKGLRGTDILCEAAEQVPDVDFHVVGGTPDMVAHWIDYASSSNIHFYGHRNPAEMPGFLGSLDAVLAPLQLQISARAPFGANMSPLKLPQYFAYGCAIIASDVPAHLETLEHERNALICRADEVADWSSAVKRLRDDAPLRERLGRNALLDYQKAHTPAIRVRKVLEGLSPGGR